MTVQLSSSVSRALASEPGSTEMVTDDEALKQCHDLTKRILLAIIELERFSLNYRLASMKQSKLALVQYAGNQEASAAGGFAAALISRRQSDLALRDPSKVSVGNLRSGLRTSFVTTVLAGSSSGIALASNMVIACQNHKRGFNSGQANRFVQSHLSRIDQLLSERDRLIAAYPEHRFARIAVQEGKILRLLRDGCFYEYAKFNKNVRNYRTGRNSFYVLNMATNVVKAMAAHYSILGLKDQRFKGPASILTVVTGAMAFASPLLSTGAGIGAGRLAWHSLAKQSGGTLQYSSEMLIAEERDLSEELKGLDPRDTQLASALARADAYATSAEHFRVELRNEARTLRTLTKVVDQSTVFGPVLGSMGISQGILSAVSYYKDAEHPARQRHLTYSSAVIGTGSSSIALGANSALVTLAVLYIAHLHRIHAMPPQLIEHQLEHLDKVEQTVRNF